MMTTMELQTKILLVVVIVAVLAGIFYDHGLPVLRRRRWRR